MTAAVAAARPAVADAVADRLLRHLARHLPPGAEDPGDGVRRTVEWSGPVTADLADERAVQAACGIMHVHGRAAGAPAPLAVDYASTVAGVLAAQGVTAVLLARTRGREPSGVRTSVAQAALLATGQYTAAATALGPDDEPMPHGAPDTAGGSATLTSAEGTRLEIETLDPQAWGGFWNRLGVPSSVAGQGWLPFQQRFATAVCPLPQALRGTVRRTPLGALRAAAAATGVSLAIVGSSPAAPEGTQPWQWAPSTGAAAPRPPARTVGAPPAPELPLAGLRVVESTRRVQGPLAGHVLRLLGAEVIRVEPPDGDPMRWLPPFAGGCSARFSALNAGKTVVEADITTARGRDTVSALVADADVFLHNWAPGRAARLGLDADDLLAVRPGLVHAWASGFGDALGARPPLGTDYLAQVYGGLAAALRPDDEPPAPSLMTLTDVLGGLVCAQGVLSALLACAHTGRGGRVTSSLLSAAALVPRPPSRVRWTALDRPVRTADGFLCLGPEARRDPDAVARLTGSGAAGASPEASAGRFASRTTKEWTDRLHDAGLTATAVRTDLATLADDPAFRAAVLAPDDAVPHARPAPPWTFA